MGNPVTIVLTGGPCAGKTSALAYLSEHLTGRGWRVLIVPEAATLLITGGLGDLGHLAAHDRPGYLAAQTHLLGLQADLRARYVALGVALGNPRTVILFDRAELDNQAYMTAAEFDRVAAANGTSPGALADAYDAVVHLVTAADGTTAYTTANNTARTETPESARTLDRATLAGWLGHPHLTVVPNRGGFETKLRDTLAAVLTILGDPAPVEIERKWLLAAAPDPTLLASAVPVEITQRYLVTDGPGEERIRARKHRGHTTYFHTTKTPNPHGPGRIEHESRIDADTYRHLLTRQDPATATVRKRRYCFAHAGQHFELDHVTAPTPAWLLEAELAAPDTPVTLPPGLVVAADVTDDPAWSNAALARR